MSTLCSRLERGSNKSVIFIEHLNYVPDTSLKYWRDNNELKKKKRLAAYIVILGSGVLWKPKKTCLEKESGQL